MGQLWMGSRERVRIFLLLHFISEECRIGLISALSQLGNRVASCLKSQGLSAQASSAQAEPRWPEDTGGESWRGDAKATRMRAGKMILPIISAHFRRSLRSFL